MWSVSSSSRATYCTILGATQTHLVLQQSAAWDKLQTFQPSWWKASLIVASWERRLPSSDQVGAIEREMSSKRVKVWGCNSWKHTGCWVRDFLETLQLLCSCVRNSWIIRQRRLSLSLLLLLSVRCQSCLGEMEQTEDSSHFSLLRTSSFFCRQRKRRVGDCAFLSETHRERNRGCLSGIMVCLCCYIQFDGRTRKWQEKRKTLRLHKFILFNCFERKYRNICVVLLDV